jgi:uncharacterized protein
MITSLYAALLALFYVWLSFRVITVRRSAKVSLGDGGDDLLARRVRAHANFAEYAPIGLILIYFVEQLWHTWWMIHALGAAFLIGRVLHAHGMAGTDRMWFKLRKQGMVLTFAVIAIGAIAILIGLARKWHFG